MSEHRIINCDYCGKQASSRYLSFPWVTGAVERYVSDCEPRERAEGTFCCGECASKWLRDEVALWDVGERWATYAPV